jgi:hypothetical protein
MKMASRFTSDTFGMGRRNEVGPPGEANIVLQIRLLCDLGVLCAKNIRDGIGNADMMKKEQDRYQAKKFEAIQLTRKLTDTFYKDTALFNIIELCMQAGETNDAKRLFDAIRANEIRNNTLEIYPELYRSL